MKCTIFGFFDEMREIHKNSVRGFCVLFLGLLLSFIVSTFLSQPDVENDLVFLRQLSTDEQAQNGQDGSEIDEWPEKIEKPLDKYYGSNNTSSSDMGNIGRFLSDIRGYLFCNYSGSDATGWNGISPFFCLQNDL
jgi:hypothetical protein